MNTKLLSNGSIQNIGRRLIFNEHRKHNDVKNSKVFSTQEKIKIVVEGQSGLLSVKEVCEREGILPLTFFQWTQDYLQVGSEDVPSNNSNIKEFTQEKKFSIVIEGKSGNISIAEICRRESISQELFLLWSKEFFKVRSEFTEAKKVRNFDADKHRKLVQTFSNYETLDYVEHYVNFYSDNLEVISEFNGFESLEKKEELECFIGLQKVNDIRYINKYFEKINSKLVQGGIFIGCLETFSARRERMRINKVPVINSIYFILEFLIKRILPKLSFTKKHYFDMTKGSDRLLSKAEGLGRLVSCGFFIMDYKKINGLLYFVVKKEQNPKYDMAPSYGPVYKMPRLGKNGKIIGVYKLRTMHPYSEYLQDYILKANGYANSGKPANDFRIPSWGHFMRRYWLDELPQLINVLKGELKLVGIRPVSKRYFEDIPLEMQKLRLTQKPGCIPPYVSLNRAGNVMSVLQSEKQYLEEKIKYPYFTDTKYFLKAIFNIAFRHKRSA